MQHHRFFIRISIVLSLAVIVLVLLPYGAHAAGEADPTDLLKKIGTVVFGGDGQPKDMQTVIGGLIKFVLSFVATIFFGLMLYAGFLWMTAQGDPEKVTKARDIMIQSTIGIVIIALAYAITFAVTSGIQGVLQ
ncbi:hypothetical protein HY624_00595 [Candidatus Uhrbacteria bacterium]|nr:hypothetical protein [Candidatus Uhrbacteria bacterium]